jgi:hypothetical protein
MCACAILGYAHSRALAEVTPPAAGGGRVFDFETAGWESCSEFAGLARAVLGAEHVVVTQTLSYDQLTPADAIVIVHPERALDVESLTRFMRSGGRIILLDDFGSGDELMEHFGLRRKPFRARPIHALRGDSRFPIADPASAHPTVYSIAHVVLNRASAIEHPDLSPVLQVALEDQSTAYVAVAGSVVNGRFLAISDSSVFINSMLKFSGNREFANSIIRYATENDTWGTRMGKLYLVSGDFAEASTLDPDDIRAQGRNLARAALEAQRNANRDGAPAVVNYIAAILAAGLLLAGFAKRIGRGFRRHIPRYARAAPLFEQGGLAGHAALLSAPSTPPALALLEWTRVLREKIKLRLGVAEIATQEQWWPELERRQLLSTAQLEQLRALLLRAAEVETRLLSGQLQKRVASTRDVEAARDTITALLATLEQGS